MQAGLVKEQFIISGILKGKTIAVGVTGGIAAYKACEIVSALKKLGADVHVVMTKAACEFVKPLTFETLSKNRVVCDMFDTDREWNVEHISLAQKADLFLIAPCSANMAGKLANGIADDFLSTTIMAALCPVVLAPAMNTAMLNSAAYRHNEAVLKKRGFIFIESESGELACGDKGDGRLANPSTIIDTVVGILRPKQDFKGKKVLITAGGTREPLDPVRFLTNRSSGKMGAELARAAAERGAEVVLVAGLISVPVPANINIVKVETTAQMHKAVLEHKKQDYYIMAAAPCDFSAEFSNSKIKAQSFNLKLTKNPDIAADVGKNKGKAKLIIFSAETENLIANAVAKLKNKNADMVVANDITKAGAGFDSDTNIISVITADKQFDYGLELKSKLADIILDKAGML